MNSIGWLGTLGMDLRYAVRMVRRNPAFSTVAIATLALGIGANTAIVNVAYAVLVKPLPYARPGEIHSAQIVIPERRAQFASIPVSIQAFQAWRDAPTVLSGVAALRPWECTLTGDGEPERVGGARVSSNFFAMLGVPVARGRGFSSEEEQTGRERVVVISDALWRRRYAADPRLVGQSITINGNAHVVVGIAPPSLLVPTGSLLHAQLPFAPRVDIWKPLAPTQAELAGESWDHGVLVRVPARRERRAGQAAARGVVAGIDPGKRARCDHEAAGRAGACARNLRRTFPSSAPPDPGSVGAAASYGLRESRQPASGACRHTDDRVRNPHRARRGPGPAGRPHARRSAGVDDGQRPCRRRPGVCRHSSAAGTARRRSPAPRRRHAGGSAADHRAGHEPRHRAGVRCAAGVAGVPWQLPLRSCTMPRERRSADGGPIERAARWSVSRWRWRPRCSPLPRSCCTASSR